MVLIPATVLDRRGALVRGLRQESFSVVQDNQPQKIASFGEQDAPVSIGIVFDVSGSMRPVLRRAKTVLKAFLEASNPEDEAFLYSFSSRPNLGSRYTSDFNTLVAQEIFADAGGSTALIDAVYAAVRQSRQASNRRKALLVISDGMDNHSRYSKSELMAAALEADLQIYCLSVYAPPLTKKPIELKDERDGVSFLDEMARRTGGIALVAHNGVDLEEMAGRIAAAMRDQYLIGYVPRNAAPDGKWHPVRIGLNVPDATAYARAGFYGR